MAERKFSELELAYIEAMLWSSLDLNNADDSDYTTLDTNYCVLDLAPSARDYVHRTCAALTDAHWELISDDLAQAGHDLWLTQNRHGAGFWDGDWPEPDATILSEFAKSLGEKDPYAGDDGLIYIMGEEKGGDAV